LGCHVGDSRLALTQQSYQNPQDLTRGEGQNAAGGGHFQGQGSGRIEDPIEEGLEPLGGSGNSRSFVG
jgi:hypothetical protein